MAMKIKETPILQGKDAERFNKILKNVEKATAEEIEEVKKAGDIFNKIFKSKCKSKLK
ncbi:MAG: hypothetical protein ACRC26_11520 [Bacteroidales bacterium]